MAENVGERKLSQIFPEKSRPYDEIVFEIKMLTIPNTIENISFGLKKGQILEFGELLEQNRLRYQKR